MTSKTETQGHAAPEMFTEMQAKWMDAMSALAQTNQRVAEGLVELSVATAKEGMRTYAEISSNAVEAVRAARPSEPTPSSPSIAELQADPFGWYQKGLLTAVEGTQKTFRLFEANAQALTRSAERLQSSAERTGKEIQEALTSYLSRMKDIYARN